MNRTKIKNILRPLVESIINERVAIQDNLLRGFTYEDLIDAIYSNERDMSEATIMRVFNELLKETITNAKEDLRDNMPFIMKQLHI